MIRSYRAGIRDTIRSARHSPTQPAKKFAQQRAPSCSTAIKLAQQAQKCRIWAIFRAQGELFRAHPHVRPRRANFFALAPTIRPSRENFFALRTQPRDNCETTITNAHPRTASVETDDASATDKRTKNTDFSPAKAMAVSTGPPHWPAKATQVSREISATPARSYKPTHQKTRT